MRIVFITTHNLATNPRLVKEIRIAIENKFEVEVICFEFDNWSKNINQQIRSKFKEVRFHTISATRKPLFPWLMSTSIALFFRFIAKAIPLNLFNLSVAVSKRSYLLKQTIKHLSQPDWIIGHNPGALYPTLYAAQKFHCKAGFDVEDYHAGEGHNIFHQSLTRRLLNKGLPKFSYVSYASLQIRHKTEESLKVHPLKSFTVLNYFPRREFIAPTEADTGRLKLCWFSQNITYGRGLELVIPEIKKNQQALELHLIGNVSQSVKNEFSANADNIFFYEPMPQEKLHISLGKYDIGLALEPAKDLNNELAISNKLLAYLQAGLFVIATDTKAQFELMKRLPTHGYCFNIESNNFREVIMRVIEESAIIREDRIHRYNNFQDCNWEYESQQLLSEWKQEAS